MIHAPANDNRGILPARRRREWRVYVAAPHCADLWAFIGHCSQRVMAWLIDRIPAEANRHRHPDFLVDGLAIAEPPKASGNLPAAAWQEANDRAEQIQPMRFFVQKDDEADSPPSV
ncbi:MAG: hypothetical protein BGO05_03870 [Rhizobiales bacterium 63-7]|nr:MAG: hypothetical protein BGO05_03870 [Rhizobiales bacterium 63-7]